RLDQRLDDLLNEEWIAARALLNKLAKAQQGWVCSKEVPKQLGDLLWAQRKQRQLLVVRPLHPRCVVLWAEVQQHECSITWRNLGDDVLDERLTRLIEPVKIFEEENGGLSGASSAGQPPNQVKKLPLACLGIEKRSRSLRIWHAEKIEHDRQPFG